MKSNLALELSMKRMAGLFTPSLATSALSMSRMLDKLGLAFLVSCKQRPEMSVFIALSSLDLTPIACRAPITSRRKLMGPSNLHGLTVPTTGSARSSPPPSALFYSTLSSNTARFISRFKNYEQQ